MIGVGCAPLPIFFVRRGCHFPPLGLGNADMRAVAQVKLKRSYAELLASSCSGTEVGCAGLVEYGPQERLNPTASPKHADAPTRNATQPIAILHLAASVL